MADSSTIILSHMVATLKSIDVIANNLANVSTVGFKRETVQFSEFIKKLPPEEDEKAPELVSYVSVVGTTRDLSQGRTDQTGAPLDLAIQGDGYFVVQTTAGQRYTRNGHFGLDGEGRVVTSGGSVLLGDAGTITIRPEDGRIQIAQDGTISGKNGTIAKISLVHFAQETFLRPQGAGLYASEETPAAAKGAILQGALEASNVEPVIEITRMIEVMRAYQASSNLLNSESQDEQQTLARLGRIPTA
ncbi:MAG: flagellar basal-body rod protein FlgF [Pseudomonadota bacterium]